MSFWAAWQFLTIIPAPRRYRDCRLADLGSSTIFFPIIGLFFGFTLLALDYLLRSFLPSTVVNILLVVTLMVLTGALHFDGLVDTCDALAIKSSAAQRLKVMTDVQVGAYGLAGGCCIILAKFAVLQALPEGLRSTGLILAPVLSRWGMVYAVYAFPSAKKEGLGWTVKQGMSWKSLSTATLLALALSWGLLSWWGTVPITALCLAIWLVSKYLSSKFGGLTGDNYGAINELGEVIVLVLGYIIAQLGAQSPLTSLLDFHG